MLLIPAGFCMMVQMASSNTLVQSMVPDAMRGRVMAVYSMMFMGMAPLGAVLSGTAAARWGAPVTVAGGGIVCMAAAAIFWWRWPNLRVEARRLIAAAQAAGGVPPQSATGGSLVLK
ncbi:MAG TPA: MFS transporter [Bryobacteraceae bacterium]|nr:MFS transporter [Bryobacteraceae bacterium]